MKYFHWKVKREHHILKEFEKDINDISKIDKIEKIIPWRINRQQKGSSDKKISFSYFTQSWLKLKIKKWATAQELFLVCKEEDKQKVLSILLSLWKIDLNN